MSKIGDFMKMLWNNPNVDDYEVSEKELSDFLSQNADSIKRVSDLESRLQVNVSTKTPTKKVAHLHVNPKKSNKDFSKENEELER